MKPVFKCDYCSKMGTEEEIKKHELECLDNYDRKSCYTCMHKKFIRFNDINKGGAIVHECKLGKEIPEGKIFEFCPQYERNKNNYAFGNLFGGLFG